MRQMTTREAGGQRSRWGRVRVPPSTFKGRMAFMAFRETLWSRRVNDGLTVTWRLNRSGVCSILASPVMQGESEISRIQE